MRISFCVLSCLVVHSGMARAYNPYCDNALADIRLHVADEKGVPVDGAMVSATFYVADSKVETVRKPTNSQGIFEARHQCNWELGVTVQKDGYYDADFETRAFMTLPKQEVAKVRRWSNGTVDIPVVIKKKCSPIKLERQDRQYWPSPATNEVVSLDLESLQWCPPYGNGKHPDLSVRYEAVERPEDGWYVSYWRRLTLSMPNAADGFYRARKDAGSQFPYAHVADTNAVFVKEIVLEIERKNDRMTKDDALPNDEYLVFRTRTETNHLGQVMRANYGRIGEGLNAYIGLSVRTWFNPKPNDTNLEDARPW